MHVKNSGRISNKRLAERDQVERALFAVSISQEDLDEVDLRTRQAIRRAPQTKDVLEPALERIAETRQRLSLSRRILAWLWRDGQSRQWKPSDES